MRYVTDNNLLFRVAKAARNLSRSTQSLLRSLTSVRDDRGVVEMTGAGVGIAVGLAERDA